MITGWCRAAVRCWAMSRPTTSTGEPGVSGTTILIGWFGNVCAWTDAAMLLATSAAIQTNLRITLPLHGRLVPAKAGSQCKRLQSRLRGNERKSGVGVASTSSIDLEPGRFHHLD